MPSKKYILSIDQGTTSSRAVLFDEKGNISGMGQKEFTQIYPKPGYVEHDPLEILETTLFAMRQAVQVSKINVNDIAAIGVTNQRETTCAWDSTTGKPVYNAIVWQCRRTSEECKALRASGLEQYIKKTTGLIIDPYFSGTKMKWIMDNVPVAAELADKGQLRFGTVDTWLIYNLTHGKTYVTDATNASRTMLFDINTLSWDKGLLSAFGVPSDALPEVVDSSGIVGFCDSSILGEQIPIAGIAGDQHAALFGQLCFERGMVKNTYGTGCFILMNTGSSPVYSENGLLTTVAWKLKDETVYALEGSAFNAGSAIQWLRDELRIIDTASEADKLAESVEDTAGAVFVPAFTGLGAPYWDMYARGALVGITRGTMRAHLCRAVLESIAMESYDLFKAMEDESGVRISGLRVDGGASRSEFLMSYQADLIKMEVVRPRCLETTAMGAAMLAGIAVDLWNKDTLQNIWTSDRVFLPTDRDYQNDIDTWHRAIKLSMGWCKLS